MKKIFRYLWNLLYGAVATVLIVYIIGMHFFPQQMKKLTGYQTFVVLTDSMEPAIPVGSLVLDKNVREGQEIPDDTIISFHVDRLGTDVVFTHYLRKKEADETGRLRYYTQGETADRYDDYKTYEEDILGTYVCHVPYIGKFVLFLQSPFALLELGIIGIITIIYHLLWARFDREEKEKAILAGAEIQQGILPAQQEEPWESDDTGIVGRTEEIRETEGSPDTEAVEIAKEAEKTEAVQKAEKAAGEKVGEKV